MKDGAVADSFYSLIRPEPNYYWDDFTEIHGLTKEATKDAPLFPEVWEKAAALIGGLPLVAHNSSFDEGCLWHGLSRLHVLLHLQRVKAGFARPA